MSTFFHLRQIGGHALAEWSTGRHVPNAKFCAATIADDYQSHISLIKDIKQRSRTGYYNMLSRIYSAASYVFRYQSFTLDSTWLWYTMQWLWVQTSCCSGTWFGIARPRWIGTRLGLMAHGTSNSQRSLINVSHELWNHTHTVLVPYSFTRRSFYNLLICHSFWFFLQSFNTSVFPCSNFPNFRAAGLTLLRHFINILLQLLNLLHNGSKRSEYFSLSFSNCGKSEQDILTVVADLRKLRKMVKSEKWTSTVLPNFL